MFPKERIRSSLDQTLKEFEKSEDFVEYLELLTRWNSIHNLTSVRDPLEMIPRHLLDSLTVLPFLKGERILDVGTGAGLPGIPLAIVRPELKFVLLDSNQKKLTFVEHVISTLKLKNVMIVHARVESYEDALGFESVVSRAFASLQEFVTKSGHLCRMDGKLIAMKGVLDKTELAALPDNYTIERIQPVFVPNLTDRCLVIVQRSSPC